MEKIFNFLIGFTFTIIFMLLGMTIVVSYGMTGASVGLGALAGLFVYDLIQRLIKFIVTRVYR